MKLKELKQTVAKFYETDISVFASEENLAKLGATKAKFDLYSQQLREIPALEGVGLQMLWDVFGQTLD